NQFLAHPEHDSLFSVTKLQTRLYDEGGNAINHDPDVLLRTQDLPPVYEENSNLYLFSAKVLQERKNRIGKKPLLFEIERDEAWDIDEEIDFRIAEFLYRERQDKHLPVEKL
ncbi:MAG: acylneuraminate cytidylyltransferase family protein, partial [Cyanobacteria bacterium]|nr:acylneuraminate cytidylyltransferase family protein [Cyanobacteria bacterium GSL.Bin21]